MATNSICHVRTEAYEEHVRGLKVQPDEARRLLAEHIRNTRHNPDPSINAAIGNYVLLVGNAYHFHLPRKSGAIPLAGYYVDGTTGKVELRKVAGSVPYPPEKSAPQGSKAPPRARRQLARRQRSR